MILILTWPRLSWTICLVSGRETLRKKKNETWKINHQWRRMRWKMKLKYLQIEADRGRLAGEQGGGSWSSILPSPHCTWNIFCWSFLDCAIAHALPVCPGFSQGQLPGALLVDLALLVGNQLPFLLWNFFIFSQYFFCWSLLWVRQYPVGFTSMLKTFCCAVCPAKIMVHIDVSLLLFSLPDVWCVSPFHKSEGLTQGDIQLGHSGIGHRSLASYGHQ